MSTTKIKGADEVFYVPTRDLVSYTPNREGTAKRVRKLKVQHPAENLYDGKAQYLVRTALIRANEYDPAEQIQITSPEDAAKLCRHLSHADQEHMVVLALGSTNRLLAIHEAAIGGTSSATVALKHMLKVGFLCSASALIFVHNHPGFNPQMSEDDGIMTEVLIKGCACVGMPMMDHVVVAQRGWTSYMNNHGASITPWGAA